MNRKLWTGIVFLSLCLLGACEEETGIPFPTGSPEITRQAQMTGQLTEVPEPTPELVPSPTETPTPEPVPSPTEMPTTGPVPTGEAETTPMLRPTIVLEPELTEGLNLYLMGDAVAEIDRLSEWQEPGVRAFDTEEGELSDRVKITGTVDTETCGCYVLRYTVQNTAGDTAVKERTVWVRMNKADVEQAEATGKVVYLTFDDGPSGHTDRLLEILDKYQAKVTFFVCGAGRVKKQLAAGHVVGAHSATHQYSIYASDEEYFQDLNTLRKNIYEKAGYSTWLVRFPGGSSNTVSRQYREGAMTSLTRLVTEAGYIYYDWNVSSGDAGKTKDPEVIVQNVIKGIKGQKVSVVLMHDIHKYTVDAIEDILIWGQENGYVFLPLTKYSREVHHRVSN